MVNVSTVGEGIYRIEVAAERRRVTCTVYLVAGRRNAIVETGPAVQAEGIMEALKQLGHDPSSIAYVVPTHIHLDHGGGAGYLMQSLPNARLVVNDRGAPHVVDPSRLIAGTKVAYGEEFEKTYGPILPVAENRVWTAKDEEEVDLGNRKLTILYTPGHAPHHICPVDSLSGGLFTGEALGDYRPGSTYLAPAVRPEGFDPVAYIASAERIVELDPPVGFFSHGGPVTGIAKLGRSFVGLLRDLQAAILQAMREGATREEIQRKTKEVFRRHLNPGLGGDAPDIGPLGIVDAIVGYYRRKGLA